MGCREDKIEFYKLPEFQSTISTMSASGLCSLYQAMPLDKDRCPRRREKVASALAPAGIQAMVEKQERNL